MYWIIVYTEWSLQNCHETLFFSSLRRWVPSTIANIFDLVREYKKTVRVNDNISMPYIGYQVMLLVGTIIGPGTIFLMLVGAFVAAFKISNWVAFGYNLIPILVYMFVCLNLPSKYQVCARVVLREMAKVKILKFKKGGFKKLNTGWSN